MIKIFKIVIPIIICLTVTNVSIVSASLFGKKDANLLADMYANPSNYIFVGAENFGVTFYIDKKSLAVHQYEPPNYIIAFKGVTHKSPDGMTKEAAYIDENVTRYRYNYLTKRIYREYYDYGKNEGTHWKNIELGPLTQKPNEIGGDYRWRIRQIAEAEIAFYLAYKMSFFDKPISDITKRMINGKPHIFSSK